MNRGNVQHGRQDREFLDADRGPSTAFRCSRSRRDWRAQRLRWTPGRRRGRRRRRRRVHGRTTRGRCGVRGCVAPRRDVVGVAGLARPRSTSYRRDAHPGDARGWSHPLGRHAGRPRNTDGFLDGERWTRVRPWRSKTRTSSHVRPTTARAPRRFDPAAQDAFGGRQAPVVGGRSRAAGHRAHGLAGPAKSSTPATR